MRNIKFRGFSKNLTNNEWVYGDLVNYSETEKIIVEQNSKTWDLLEGGIIIDEKSIGQFTGLHDKNKKEIYEGELIDFGNSNPVEVKFDNGCFNVFNEPLGWDFDSEEIPIKTNLKYCKIIGNVFENADLVKL